MTSVAPDTRVSLTPRAAEIAAVARHLVEEDGIAALSMRNLASRLGIRAASLYEHFADKRAVENAIIAAGLYEQGDYIAERVDQVRTGRVQLIARAFREFALAHPALYQLIMSRGLDRGAPDVAAAEAHASTAIREEVDGDEALSASLLAFSHGMVDLELNDRLPSGVDVEAVWDAGLQSLEEGLDRRPPSD